MLTLNVLRRIAAADPRTIVSIFETRQSPISNGEPMAGEVVHITCAGVPINALAWRETPPFFGFEVSKRIVCCDTEFVLLRF
jgi:hypothetical protein